MRSIPGKTVAMYFGQPVANLREFLPDEAILPIKMGDGEAPVVEEFKYLGSMLSKNFPGPTVRCQLRAHGTPAAHCRRRFAHRSGHSRSFFRKAYLSIKQLCTQP